MGKKQRRVPRYLREDPAYQEQQKRQQLGVPRDAITADQTQQAPNNSYSAPKYYVDRSFACVDCKGVEVWTAEQQQWWYEVAKGSIYAVAKRCRACRQAWSAKQKGTPMKTHQDRMAAAARRGDAMPEPPQSDPLA